MRYEIMYGQLCTVITQWGADGCIVRTIYVHRAEYRHWDA